jgi:uncharacterized protein with FMN-binding domain
MGESLKKTVTGFEKTGAAAAETTTHYGKTVGAVSRLSGALGAQSGAAGQAATALSSLLSTGLNPVAIATAALAVTIGILIKQHQEQAAAAKAATDAYRGQQMEIASWQGKIAALRAGTNDGDSRSLQLQLSLAEQGLANLKIQEEANKAERTAQYGRYMGYQLRKQMGEYEDEISEKVVAQAKVVEDLRLALSRVTTEREIQTTGVVALAAAETARWETVKKQGEEERKRDLGDAAARVKLAATVKQEQDLYDLKGAYADAVLSLQAQNAEAEMSLNQKKVDVDLGLAAVSGGDMLRIKTEYLERLAELQKVSQQQELQSLWDHYADQFKAMDAAGLDTLRLKEEFQIAATAIETKNEKALADEKDRIDGILKSFTKNTEQISERASRSMGSVRTAFQGVTGACREMNAEAEKALKSYLSMALAAQSTADLYNAAYGRGGASYLNVGAIMANRSVVGNFGEKAENRAGANVNVNVNNTAGHLAGAKAKATIREDGTVDVSLEIAEDLRLGGDAAKALERKYGIRAQGNQR